MPPLDCDFDLLKYKFFWIYFVDEEEKEESDDTR